LVLTYQLTHKVIQKNAPDPVKRGTTCQHVSDRRGSDQAQSYYNMQNGAYPAGSETIAVVAR
jgi:hypothetical protein